MVTLNKKSMKKTLIVSSCPFNLASLMLKFILPILQSLDLFVQDGFSMLFELP